MLENVGTLWEHDHVNGAYRGKLFPTYMYTSPDIMYVYTIHSLGCLVTRIAKHKKQVLCLRLCSQLRHDPRSGFHHLNERSTKKPGSRKRNGKQSSWDTTQKKIMVPCKMLFRPAKSHGDGIPEGERVGVVFDGACACLLMIYEEWHRYIDLSVRM